MFSCSQADRGLRRNGFTLVEMLIVVFIVGLLAIMSIGSYTHYRKGALLNLAADNLISTLYQARQEVKSGKTDVGSNGDEIATCRGLSLSVTSEESGGVLVAKTEFVSKKSFDGLKWVSQGCTNDSLIESAIALDDLVRVKSIEPAGSYILLFEPPEGEFVITGSDANNLDSFSELKVVLKYGEGDDDDYTRKILINKKTGNATIAK